MCVLFSEQSQTSSQELTHCYFVSRVCLPFMWFCIVPFSSPWQFNLEPAGVRKAASGSGILSPCAWWVLGLIC